MAAEIERRLTSILSADVFGFSRLMGQDERGTLATLNAQRGAIDGLIARHRGRLVSTAGDSVLAEFASPVQAVQCAVEMQRAIAERNAALTPERQMWFRIGIHLGDVIVENDNIFGDDVNIAARLQSIAEPGGVLISGTVFEQVKSKLQLGFDFLGPQQLKNVSTEVPVYRANLQPAPGVSAAASERTDTAPKGRKATLSPEQKRHRLINSGLQSGAILLLLVLVNAFSWDGDLWVQWPALAILFLFAMRALHLYRPT